MSEAFERLDGEKRRRAEALAEKFRAVGADEPEEWAASEVEADIPQLARFLFLRRLWRGAGQWKQPPADWFADIELDDDADGFDLSVDLGAAWAADDDDGKDDGEDEEDNEDLLADEGDPPFLAAQQAVQRILAAGADAEDLKEVARAIFLYTAFDAVHTLDDGYDPQVGEGMPGWLLTEVGGDLILTGRTLDALHEDLLTTEPDEVDSA